MKKAKQETVSVSTLMRMARKAKPAEAKKLRAQAAEMRRDARKGAKTEIYPSAKKLIVESLSGTTKIDLLAPQPETVRWVTDAQSTAGSNVDLIDAANVTARAFVVMARQKNGADEIAKRLISIQALAEHEGRDAATKRAAHTAKMIREANEQAAIGGFIAVCAREISRNGRLPPVVDVAGALLQTIIDVLTRNGYTPQGRTSLRDE